MGTLIVKEIPEEPISNGNNPKSPNHRDFFFRLFRFSSTGCHGDSGRDYNFYGILSGFVRRSAFKQILFRSPMAFSMA